MGPPTHKKQTLHIIRAHSNQACAAQAAGLSGGKHIRPAESRQQLQVAVIQEQLQALEHRLSQQQQEQLGVSVCRDCQSRRQSVYLKAGYPQGVQC